MAEKGIDKGKQKIYEKIDRLKNNMEEQFSKLGLDIFEYVADILSEEEFSENIEQFDKILSKQKLDIIEFINELNNVEKKTKIDFKPFLNRLKPIEIKISEMDERREQVNLPKEQLTEITTKRIKNSINNLNKERKKMINEFKTKYNISEKEIEIESEFEIIASTYVFSEQDVDKFKNNKNECQMQKEIFEKIKEKNKIEKIKENIETRDVKKENIEKDELETIIETSPENEVKEISVEDIENVLKNKSNEIMENGQLKFIDMVKIRSVMNLVNRFDISFDSTELFNELYEIDPVNKMPRMLSGELIDDEKINNCSSTKKVKILEELEKKALNMEKMFENFEKMKNVDKKFRLNKSEIQVFEKYIREPYEMNLLKDKIVDENEKTIEFQTLDEQIQEKFDAKSFEDELKSNVEALNITDGSDNKNVDDIIEGLADILNNEEDITRR